jgi:D-3-phosphoglycerate dehydrogenase
MKRKLLFADGLSDDLKHQLEANIPEAQVEVYENLSKPELIKKMPGVEVLGVRTKTNVDRDVLKSSKQLKLIARAGTGVDHIDLQAATQLGIAA